ncbi:unnamed protein product, partial [Choristocarpus tenellus]
MYQYIFPCRDHIRRKLSALVCLVLSPRAHSLSGSYLFGGKSGVANEASKGPPSKYPVTRIREGSTLGSSMSITSGEDKGKYEEGFSHFLQKSAAGARIGFAEVDIVHAVVGNQACDADSICSAMCLAFLKSITPAVIAGDDGVEKTIQFVPVMSIPREDLALRQEVLVLFDLCDVDPVSVVFSDEVDLAALQAEGRLRLTLTDHNALAGNHKGLSNSVVEIVDHHLDTKEHLEVDGDSRDIAFDAESVPGKALVGSCCTMVAERMLSLAPDSVAEDVARLLLGVILIDTANLDPKVDRATPRDNAVVEELRHRLA